MYLSQLEILGFKSFPEKTILDFNGGITAVVGPNGCGKTNILDSIRWVLGEQRSSMLRSSKMEEVIFNGTALMRPLGLAEVNLTIKNNRGILPVEYDEVVITRRLYRSGESEYLLNKSQCRLKDIMELFYDTGMGPHAYSVIQQGMIDAILSDKAEDRRALFEEAAGVTKYKHRKKEAIGKLEATRADLLRLGDIIGEIEKQVNQLRRQAAKARQYGRQKDELKQLELAIASGHLYQLQDRYRELGQRRETLEIEIAALNADYEMREMGLQEARLRMTELEHQAAAERQSQAEHTARASEVEGEIKLNKHRVESATSEIADDKTQIEALRSRIESLSRGIDENNSRLASLDEQKKTLAVGSGDLESELAEKAKDLAPCEAEVNDIRKRNSSFAERISALKAEAVSLAGMKANLEQKKHELKKDADSIDETRGEKEDGLLALDQKRRGLEIEIEELKKNIQAKSGEIVRIENYLSQKREIISKDKAELSGFKARQELLGQLIESGEGYSLGAKSLMSWADRPAGILPPLAEVLEVPEEYRVAVAASLGNLSEIIPARSLGEAQSAIDFLKASDGGRASFLVMERIELAALHSERPASAAGFIGFLDELVSYPDEYRLAINLLLGRVALFKTRDEAFSAGAEWDLYTKVDLDGFTMMPPAVVSGGKITSGVLGRRQDLSAVESLMGEIKSRLDQAQADLDANIKSLQTHREELAASEKTIRRLDEDKRRIEAELGQMQFDFKERETRYTNAVTQARNIETEIAQFAQKLERLEMELSELDIQSKKGAEELSGSSARLLDLRQEVSRLESRLTEARIKAIEHDGLEARLASDIAHGRELIAEAEKMIDSDQTAIEKAEALIKTSLAQNEELETRLYDIFAQRREVQARLREVEDAITEAIADTGKIDDELSRHRKEKDRLTSSLHAVELEFLEQESNRKSIIERLKMEFNVSAIEPAPIPEGKTPEGLAAEAQEIRSRLQRMDPVNLVAAEDYEREKDRLDFLIRQRDDLVDAENSLKEAITRINITAETRFRETFALIQQNFENVFLSLFAGGEARLELEDDSSPLDSPIRILARPGGKRLLSVAQLSGGERALTAISLLFGIYLVKPSPFCILDEVDAPLDDANLLRFLKLIKDFSGTTQFIVITHNKMTMEASDILYGVTMETPGVSKVVSVKFAGNGNGNGNGDGNGHDDGGKQ